MGNRSKPGSYRRWNRRIRMECHGGKELLDALRDVGNMLQAISDRHDDGDEMAGHKLGVAQVCSDRLIEIRSAMIEGLKRDDNVSEN